MLEDRMTAREYLERELGNKYIDIIELEWGCNIEEFIVEYMEYEEDVDSNPCWYCKM